MMIGTGQTWHWTLGKYSDNHVILYQRYFSLPVTPDWHTAVYTIQYNIIQYNTEYLFLWEWPLLRGMGERKPGGVG